MQRRYLKGLMIAVAILALVCTGTMTGCAKKSVTSTAGTDAPAVTTDSASTVKTGTTQRTTPGAATSGMSEEELARQRALEQKQRMEQEKARIAAEKMARFNTQNIHFSFDSSALSPEAMNILKDKAIFLRTNPAKGALIKGHCDERGSAEYNLALGDRRANSAKNFLEDLGIDSRRITTISYGEEQPMDPGHNEGAWAANRRCEFALE